MLRYEDIPLEVEEKNDKIKNMNDLFSPQVNKNAFYKEVKIITDFSFEDKFINDCYRLREIPLPTFVKIT